MYTQIDHKKCSIFIFEFNVNSKITEELLRLITETFVGIILKKKTSVISRDQILETFVSFYY